ncbi:PREDICTED: F-box/kelch-repeat protein At3g06240-like [Fragaria vesca subsp. vesca]|uniref:F-box/kelch-repeat protein At3g06240-like n=1 Tax=Fragaria vesca subsp. vesca TaxID=101020 RepID=UPI0002C31740|nr:PREDICTED: F-box/kelch-repeat protein At3g06240-like [Fragaria vesca subsp. vesca]
MNFSLVCKSWRGLISQVYQINGARKQLYCPSSFSCSGRNKVRLLYSVKPPRSIEYAALNKVGHSVHGNELNFPELQKVKIVGSCDGIICLEEGINVYLWNPTTTEIRTLMKPKGFQSMLMFYGFGLDPTLDDYKVILGNSVEEGGMKTLKVAVFKLREGIWSSKHGLDYMQVSGQGHYLDGALHWTEMRRVWPHPPVPGTRIVSLCLTDEVFKESLQVADLTGGQIYISERIARAENGLVLYMYGLNSIKIWLSKTYKVKTSWMNVIHLDLKFGGPGALRTTNIEPIFYSEDGKLFVSLDGKELVVYDREKKGFRTAFVCSGLAHEPVLYIDSLISPFKGLGIC